MSIKGKQVLVIDDTEEVRILARKILETMGLTVTLAASVDEALSYLDTQVPHLIILDLEMPVKSGFQFLSFRSLTPKLREVPVIVASSRNDKDSIHKALSLGANDYILKPFALAILGQRVRKHTSSHEYMTFKFPKPLSEVSLQIKSQITGIGDTSIRLDSPVKLGQNVQVEIIPPEIAEVNIENCVLKSGLETGTRNSAGNYSSKIEVSGLQDTITKIIKFRGLK